MEAKYHIITDISCKVLHFGREVCTVTPSEDACIFLQKGKHILAFVSLENENDKYEIVESVPENDIESFINVELLPYKQKRQEQEEQYKRTENERIQKQKQEELDRNRLFEIQEEKRKAVEEKKQRERNREQKEHMFYLKECELLNEYLKAEFECPTKCEVLYPKKDKVQYGYVDSTAATLSNTNVDRWVISPKYDFASSFFYGIAIVGNIVEMRPGFYDWQYSYIDSDGKRLYTLKNTEQGTAFHKGICFIFDRSTKLLRIMSPRLVILMEKQLSDLLDNYSRRSEFPIYIKKKSSFSIEFSYKRYELNEKLSRYYHYPISCFFIPEMTYEEEHSSPDNLRRKAYRHFDSIIYTL